MTTTMEMTSLTRHHGRLSPILEEKDDYESPKISRLGKNTKKRIRDSIMISLIFVTLLTTVLGGTGLLKKDDGEVANDNLCRSVTLRTIFASICENDPDHIKVEFPNAPYIPPIRWKREQIEDITNIIDYLVSLDYGESFKFYYLPDLIFVKNDTNIEVGIRGQVIDLNDFYEMKLFVMNE